MSRRIILGHSPSRSGSMSGGYGLYVSKAGYDADTASNANMVFSSDWPHLLPIIQKGTTSVSPNTLTTVGFATQNLIPFADFAWTYSSTYGYGGASFSYGMPPFPPGSYGAYVAGYFYSNGANYPFVRTRISANQFDVIYSVTFNQYVGVGYPFSLTWAYAIFQRPS